MKSDAWAKSPPELVSAFDRALAGLPGAERRQMFGYACAFVGGNMFTGLFAAGWFVRLAEPDRARLLALDGASIFSPMPGRPMREYVVLPASVVADVDALQPWLDAALDHAGSLPAKPATPAGPRKPKPGPSSPS